MASWASRVGTKLTPEILGCHKTIAGQYDTGYDFRPYESFRRLKLTETDLFCCSFGNTKKFLVSGKEQRIAGVVCWIYCGPRFKTGITDKSIVMLSDSFSYDYITRPKLRIYGTGNS